MAGLSSNFSFNLVLFALFCFSILLMIITRLLSLNRYINNLAELWKPSDEFSLFFWVSQPLIRIIISFSNDIGVQVLLGIDFTMREKLFSLF